MHLIELLLPVQSDEGDATAGDQFERIAVELTDAFGGVTAFTRSPAEGLWNGKGRTERDDIVTFEVMVDAIDREWWATYRRDLEKRFDQAQIIIRSHEIERL
jgi:hypothetical protein